MTERRLSKQERRFVGREFFDFGLCPNTGESCDAVKSLSDFSRSTIESMSTQEEGYTEGSTHIPALNAVSNSVTRVFDRALLDSEACLGGCALLGEDLDKLIG